MSDDRVLDEAARRGIRAQKLPDRHPDGMYGGLGSGADCAICGSAVAADQSELELEFVRDDHPSPERYHVHAHCFAVWDVDRQTHAPAGRATTPRGRRPSTAAANGRHGTGSNGDGAVDGSLPNAMVTGHTVARDAGRPHKERPA